MGRVIREFFAGFAVLARGFGLWRRRPRLMLLGLLPAVIVAAILIATVIAVGVNLEGIARAITPFADAWDPQLAELFRAVVALAVLIGLITLGAFGFTAITLLVGEPVYERIWRAIELEHGELPEGEEPGFFHSLGDSIRLFWRAVLTGMLVAAVGLIPVVGVAVALALELLLGGRIVALELTSRPLEARGLRRAQRREVLRTRNPRVIGFGVAVHLCILVPGGAILVMPAAVAGATELALHAVQSHAAKTHAAANPEPA
jgi:CysZ protein